MSQKKTPGVYIVEQNAFPNSVVEVATAVPAFIGYTEKALCDTQTLTMVPTRISSLAEYRTLFGGAPLTRYGRVADGESVTPVPETNFLLYKSLRLFFDNGGSTCWIVSLGSYGTPNDTIDKSPDPFLDALALLEKEPEPTMLVAPEAVLLSEADWARVSQQMLAQSIRLKSRIAILDIFDGDQPRLPGNAADVIERFRNTIEGDDLSYGVAYYPWVNASLVSEAEIDFRWLSSDFADSVRETVKAEMYADFDAMSEDEAKRVLAVALNFFSRPYVGDAKTFMAAALNVFSQPFEGEGAEDKNRVAHRMFMANSAGYRQAMEDVLRAANVLPPSAGLAGVYARTDAAFGVFKAPANTGMVSVVAPCVAISHDEQEDLNTPINGKAVNAIRSFEGLGVLVWGARTLDGNDQDWRYVPVRRTAIFLEQSIRAAAEAYVFSPNTSQTWVTVANMIRNFLRNQWKAGALVGASPDEAYQVSAGLGNSVTGNDVLDEWMQVTVKVAITHPSEFIVLTFQQKMQTS